MRQQRVEDRERLSDDDFATLFEQLDRDDPAAIDCGLLRLVSSIEEWRRLAASRR